MKAVIRMGLIMTVMLSVGCAHQVAFQNIDYSIDEQIRDEPVVVVIGEAERARVVPVRAVMTGAAHSWNAEPGEMLMQVTEVEMPQMFSHYELMNRLPGDNSSYVLELAVPDYRFEEFRAKVKVYARMTGLDGQELLDQLYQSEGPSTGGRMFWGGAFAMKSAMRTSSIDAFKEIFSALRADLNRILDDSKAEAIFH